MTEQATRWPLSWPAGWPRTKPGLRKAAKFSKTRTASIGTSTFTRKEDLTVFDAVKRLTEELRRLGASAGTEVLSTNLVTRLDGLPRSDQRAPEDPGAAVYFRLKGQPRVLACDRWTRVADNIAAIAAHIEAIRAVDRYGVGSLEQAFAGYVTLPEAATDWWVILGVPPNATWEDANAAFLRLAQAAHPDKQGGSHEQMARLSEAREKARKAAPMIAGASRVTG
jgi:hypothetical protein